MNKDTKEIKDQSKQLRRIFLTWNNWRDDFKDKDEVSKYISNLTHFKGAVIGFEVGEQGTEHLQGVVAFKAGKTFKTLTEYFKKNHIEEIRNFPATIEYCKKDGDYIEIGKLVNQGARKDVSDFRDAIQAGMSDRDLLSLYPNEYFKFEHLITKVRQIDMAEKYSEGEREIKVIYLEGVSRVGKTSFVFREYGYKNTYRVSDYDHPFDDYQFEDILVLDEFRGQMPLGQILNLLDVHPVSLSARYKNRWGAYKTVFVISNRTFDEQYKNMKYDHPEDYNAWRERFHGIFWMNKENRNEVIEKIKTIVGEKK